MLLAERKIASKVTRVRGKAIGKSENSRLIDEAFCQMIESLLTIVIDNTLQKAWQEPHRNCVLARREGYKSELLGRVTRYYDKRAKIDTNKDLFWNCCISYLIFFIRFARCFLFDSKNTGIKYRLFKIYILFVKLKIYTY